MPSLPRMKAIYLHAISGYREALSRAKSNEFRTREDNWLCLPAEIAGCKVRILTVRDYVALLRLQNAFVLRVEPTLEDLGSLLWLLSPEIERWHNRIGWRKRWLVDCRWSLFSVERWQIRLAAKKLRSKLKMKELENAALAFNRGQPGKLPPPIYQLPEDCELARAFTAGFEYMDRIFLDRPAGVAKEGTGSGLLYLASWFDAMQSEYHMSDEAVWKMPLPVLFARLKAIAHRTNPGEPDFNARQDAVNAQILKANFSDLVEGRFKFQDN
jgi:hypothetical protein